MKNSWVIYDNSCLKKREAQNTFCYAKAYLLSFQVAPSFVSFTSKP